MVEDSVCETCTDVVTEYAMTVGEDYHDAERMEMLARISGGEVPEHSCDADGDDDVDCACGCQDN